MNIKYADFTDDFEKVRDLLHLSKEEFLTSYSYITETEYENTVGKILSYVKTRVNTREKLKAKRKENPEIYRKENLKYYYKNREEILKKRKSKK